jgi:tetratricopeptide (TPR) repeat protein
MKTILLLSLCLLALTARAALSDADVRDAYHKSYRFEKTQSYPDAIRALAPVIDAYPQGYTVNLRLGWLSYLQGSHAAARAHYETAIRAAPDSIEARLGSLLPLLAQEHYADVEAGARLIIRKDPANYFANLRLATALRLQKKYDAAEEIVNRQLGFYPTDVGLLTELGLLKLAKNLPADRIFNDILTLDPENAVARAQLAKRSSAPSTNAQPSTVTKP